MDKTIRCVVCGNEVPRNKAIMLAFRYKRTFCDECSAVGEIDNVCVKHWDLFMKAKYEDPVEQRNYFKDTTEEGNPYVGYTLDKFSYKYDVKNRSKQVETFIKEIDYARRYLYTNIKPHMQILESLFDRKQTFWLDAGNAWYYIRQSLISYIVIQTKEYFDRSKQNKSKLSLYRFINIIRNNKKALYEDPIIKYVRTFNKSGDISTVFLEQFPINDFLERLQDVLDLYSPILESIEDYRDNVFAHVGDLKNKDDHESYLTLQNLRKIVNSLTIILDDLSYSIAPDKYSHLEFDYNIWLDRWNRISQEYKKRTEKLKNEL